MKTNPAHRQLVLDYCLRKQPPILVGRILTETKMLFSLPDVEGILEDLVTEGILRHLTPVECSQFDVAFGYKMV